MPSNPLASRWFDILTCTLVPAHNTNWATHSSLMNAWPSWLPHARAFYGPAAVMR